MTEYLHNGPSFDADVQCTPPSPDELYPYLPAQWVEHMQKTGFRGPLALRTQPWWLPIRKADGDGIVRVEEVQADVLAEARGALLRCYWGAESFTHPYFGPAVATAVNRWLQEEWLDKDDRLLAAAAVTPEHVDAAVAEVERVAADGRFASIYVPGRAPAPYGSEQYWPIWEAAARHGLAISIGVNGSTGTQPTAIGWLSSHWEEYVAGVFPLQSHIASFAVCGLLDRHPDLRIVFNGSGVSWLPSLCWRLDSTWRAMHREVPWMDGLPSTYVKRFMRFTSNQLDLPAEPEYARQTLDMVGMEEMLLYASDYPHGPDAGNDLLFEVLSQEEQERLRWGNAVEAYGLERRLPTLTTTPPE